MATPVQIVVNGFSGPLCTLDASTEWTIQQVKEAIQEKIDVKVDWQKLLKGTELLLGEATVSSLIADEQAGRLELTLLVQPTRPVDFVGMSNGLEQVEPGHLQKTGGDEQWDATAVSTESLTVGQGRGLRFRPGTMDKDFMIGLGSSSSAPADFAEIDYAARCAEHGRMFYVFERGDEKFDGGIDSYSENTEVDLLVHTDRVEFYVGGALKYISQLRAGVDRLFAMASFLDLGGEAQGIQWL